MPLLAMLFGLVGAARLLTSIFDVNFVGVAEGLVLIGVAMALVMRKS